ncbi:MAG: TylF/MycF/NovP-related O-methyltransferase [Kordiimonas sp.]
MTDSYTAAECDGLPIIVADAPDFDPETLRGLPYVIYAMDCDDVGAKMVAILEKYGVPFYAARLTPLGITAKYYHIRQNVRECLRIEHDDDTADKMFHFNEPDFMNIAQAIDITKNVQGAYVEVGTFNGASARFALRHMEQNNVARHCYFMDVFTGFDYATAKDSPDTRWAGSHNSHGYEVVKGRLKKFESDRLKVCVRKNNIIEDDFPDDIGPIAVANLDVDMLEAVRAGLQVLSHRIVSGGILIVEDPGHTPTLIGARVALNEFLKDDESFMPIYMESGQTYLIKK